MCFVAAGSAELFHLSMHVQNDFTPEEEEEVRRENQWAFD